MITSADTEPVKAVSGMHYSQADKEGYSKQLVDVLLRIAYICESRGVIPSKLFQDYDWSHRRVITKSQFQRSLTNLLSNRIVSSVDYPVSPEEVKLLAETFEKAHRGAESTREEKGKPAAAPPEEVWYMKFCAAVEDIKNHPAATQETLYRIRRQVAIGGRATPGPSSSAPTNKFHVLVRCPGGQWGAPPEVGVGGAASNNALCSVVSLLPLEKRIFRRLAERKLSIRDLIDEHDERKTGIISVDQLRQVISCLNCICEEGELESLVKKYEWDTGLIDAGTLRYALEHADDATGRGDAGDLRGRGRQGRGAHWGERGEDEADRARAGEDRRGGRGPSGTDVFSLPNEADLTDVQRKEVKAVEDRIFQWSTTRRVDLRSFIPPFDTHRRGVVSATNFARALAQAGLSLTQRELSLLALKYSDHLDRRGLLFHPFLRLLEDKKREGLGVNLMNTRTLRLGDLNARTPVNALTAGDCGMTEKSGGTSVYGGAERPSRRRGRASAWLPGTVWDVVERARAKVKTRPGQDGVGCVVALDEYFGEVDKYREGQCNKADFMFAMRKASIPLTSDEAEACVAHYRGAVGTIDFVGFLRDVYANRRPAKGFARLDPRRLFSAGPAGMRSDLWMPLEERQQRPVDPVKKALLVFGMNVEGTPHRPSALQAQVDFLVPQVNHLSASGVFDTVVLLAHHLKQKQQGNGSGLGIDLSHTAVGEGGRPECTFHPRLQRVENETAMTTGVTEVVANHFPQTDGPSAAHSLCSLSGSAGAAVLDALEEEGREEEAKALGGLDGEAEFEISLAQFLRTVMVQQVFIAGGEVFSSGGGPSSSSSSDVSSPSFSGPLTKNLNSMVETAIDLAESGGFRVFLLADALVGSDVEKLASVHRRLTGAGVRMVKMAEVVF